MVEILARSVFSSSVYLLHLLVFHKSKHLNVFLHYKISFYTYI